MQVQCKILHNVVANVIIVLFKWLSLVQDFHAQLYDFLIAFQCTTCRAIKVKDVQNQKEIKKT